MEFIVTKRTQQGVLHAHVVLHTSHFGPAIARQALWVAGFTTGRVRLVDGDYEYRVYPHSYRKLKIKE